MQYKTFSSQELPQSTSHPSRVPVKMAALLFLLGMVMAATAAPKAQTKVSINIDCGGGDSGKEGLRPGCDALLNGFGFGKFCSIISCFKF